MFCAKCGYFVKNDATKLFCPKCGTQFRSEHTYSTDSRKSQHFIDYYELLQVSRHASKDVIMQAYKVLAKKYHPDLSMSSQQINADMMREINVARDVLMDDVTRADYDRQLLRKTSDEDRSRVVVQKDNPQSSGNSNISIDPDFRKSTSSNITNKSGTASKFWRSTLGCCTLIVLASLVFIGIASLSEISNTKNTTDSTSQLKQVAFLPNGLLSKYYTVEDPNELAPLELITNSTQLYYYIKVVNNDTNQVVLTAFMHPNSQIDLEVPLGSYRIRCASGKAWYGYSDLFGTDGNYAEFDDVFKFYVSGDKIHGYTIELFLQTNGNLDSNTISKNDF